MDFVKEYKYQLIFVFTIAFWIAETWYFGWNMEPINAKEALADNIVVVLLVFSTIGNWVKDVSFVKKISVTLKPGQKLEEVL